MMSRPSDSKISVKITKRKTDMENVSDIKELVKMIADIEAAANGLIENSQGIQAIERNAERILASTAMLKINVSDVIE
jgi:uncharacterized membrane protein YjjP (DUF1212 family)